MSFGRMLIEQARFASIFSRACSQLGVFIAHLLLGFELLLWRPRTHLLETSRHLRKSGRGEPGHPHEAVRPGHLGTGRLPSPAPCCSKTDGQHSPLFATPT